MARRYGRCPRGERLIGRVPLGTWKTLTFVAGLRCDEMTAPLVIEGAMNGEIFLSYVEQCLAPALNHGDIVVMDNLRAHKVAGVEEAIEAVGAELLYLPKYSPDLNPIEMSFSKLKAYLRKAAERTQRSLRRRIGLFVPRLPSARRMRQLLRSCRICFNLEQETAFSVREGGLAATGTATLLPMYLRLPVGCPVLAGRLIAH